jgi:hypothetical protein
MTSRRTTGSTLLLVGVLVCTAAPASTAAANPLLSGYGGPGQGSQAILGAGLVGGGSGGGGSQGGGSTGSAPPSSGASRYGEPLATGTESSSRAGVSKAGGGSSRGSTGRSGTREARGVRASGAALYPTAVAERAYLASAAADTGGLSGSDLTYALLALVVLALTAALTRAFSRTADRGAHPRLKQRVAGPE